PRLKIDSNVKQLFDFKIEDFELVDYNPCPAIKAPVAV
ncbi:MAG: thymidylate synthase, partial [Proteobacteria bacterium]|nr:thymidylate synthase [Pseudomonadota bacterium]